jgi:hypothetical protein
LYNSSFYVLRIFIAVIFEPYLTACAFVAVCCYTSESIMAPKLTFDNVALVERRPVNWSPDLVATHFTEFDFITTEVMPTWQPVKDGEVVESVGPKGSEMPDDVDMGVIWLDAGVRVQPTWGVVWFQPHYDDTPVALVGVFGKAPLDGLYRYEGPGKVPSQMYTTQLPGAGVDAGMCVCCPPSTHSLQHNLIRILCDCSCRCNDGR